MTCLLLCPLPLNDQLAPANRLLPGADGQNFDRMDWTQISYPGGLASPDFGFDNVLAGESRAWQGS